MALNCLKCIILFTRTSVFRCNILRSNVLVAPKICQSVKVSSVNLYSTQPNDSAARTSATSKKKGAAEPKITLLGTDGSMIAVTTVTEAQKLSKRRDMRLVKTVELDTKTGRSVYQLMTGAQFFEEEKKQRNLLKSKRDVGFKGEKIVSVNCKINEHDLKSKLNKMLGWLAKKYEVRVAITADSDSVALAEQVYQSIVEGIKTDGKIVQKRLKGSEIRFQVLPPKQDIKSQADTVEDQESSS